MTAVPVPALVAAITDELAKHPVGSWFPQSEVATCMGLNCDWRSARTSASLVTHEHRAHVAERVAATVVGLLPGLPPEDLAALFASRGAFITGGDSVYVPGLDRLPAPAEPERGE